MRPTAASVGATFGFFGVALAGTLAGLVGLLASWSTETGFNPYAPAFLASVHALLVGGLLSLYLGSAYQLVPVVAERPCPWLTRLAPIHALLHIVGVGLLVGGFWTGQAWALGVGGAGIFMGLALLALASLGALERRRSWAPESLGLYAGFAWLMLAMGLGLWMALARLGWVTLELPVAAVRGVHLRLGLVGFFLQVLIGLSHRLVPMFVVSRRKGTTAATAALLMLNLGLLLGVIGQFGELEWLVRWADTLLAVSLLPHGLATVAQLRSRMRPLGGAFWTYGLGTAGLLACGGLALWREWAPAGQAEFPVWLPLAAMLPLGFVPIALAVSARIIPFLAWQAVFAPQIGRRKLPTVQALWSERTLWAEFALIVTSSVFWGWALLQPGTGVLFTALGTTVTTLAIRLANCGYMVLRIRHLTSQPSPSA